MSAFLGGSSTERRGGKSPGRHPVVIKLFTCGGADGGRFSDPTPDPGVPLGRRSCVDSRLSRWLSWLDPTWKVPLVWMWGSCPKGKLFDGRKCVIISEMAETFGLDFSVWTWSNSATVVSNGQEFFFFFLSTKLLCNTITKWNEGKAKGGYNLIVVKNLTTCSIQGPLRTF